MSPPLPFESGPSFVDPKKKNEKNELCSFYKTHALKEMMPTKYKLCEELPFDVYSPSVKIGIILTARIIRICTTKTLLKRHLRATQHHFYDLDEESEVEGTVINTAVDKLPIIEDGSCLIPSMEQSFFHSQ